MALLCPDNTCWEPPTTMSTSEAQDAVERRHRDWGGGAHNVMGFQVLLKCLFSLSAFVQGFFLIVESKHNKWASSCFFLREMFSGLDLHIILSTEWVGAAKEYFSPCLLFISDFLVGGQVSDPIGKKTSGQMFFSHSFDLIYFERKKRCEQVVCYNTSLFCPLQTFAVLFWISMYLFSGITFTAFLVIKEYLN